LARFREVWKRLQGGAVTESSLSELSRFLLPDGASEEALFCMASLVVGHQATAGKLVVIWLSVVLVVN